MATEHSPELPSVTGSTSSKIIHVVVIHGTWGHGENLFHGLRRSLFWNLCPKPKQDEQLIQWDLVKDFKDRNIKHSFFNWSGKNSHKWRIQAGKELVEYLKTKILPKKKASEEIILLAHSHGGNVILYAMKDMVIAENITRCVFLSVPFLSFSSLKVSTGVFPRMINSFWLLKWLCLGSIPVVGTILGYLWISEDIQLSPAMFLVPLIYVVVAFIVHYVSKECEKVQSRLERGESLAESYQPAFPPVGEGVYIVRKTGDEATLFVNAGRALEVLMSWVWTGVNWVCELPTIVPKKLGDAAERFRKHYPKWSLLPALALLVLSLPLLIDEVSRIFIYGMLFLALGLAPLIGGIQLFLLNVMGALHFCRFGTGNKFSDLFFMEATTEVAPLESWQINIYPGKGFRHSECYKDPEIREKIIAWICRRDQLPKRTQLRIVKSTQAVTTHQKK